MNETRRLAQYVADTSFKDLPSQVVEASKIYILDNLASGFVGSTTLWAESVATLAHESSPAGPCSMIGRSGTTSPSYAALVNGTMIGGFETDHAFSRGSSHPSSGVFPACMAIAERDRLTGQELITSMVLGYEVACRVGAAATRAVEDVAGFHGPGTNASFGSAAGVGKALNLDQGELTNALGIAGSHAGGLLEFINEGSMTKRIHAARGGQMGLESALLAKGGFTGPSTVLEGDRGFLKVYSPSPQPELLVDGLGEDYLMQEMTLKQYACHMSFHPVIAAICRFKAEGTAYIFRLDGVKVVTRGSMIDRHGQRAPTSILGAQYSLPFSVALALIHDVGNPRTYCEETLGDSRVRELALNIELEAHEERPGEMMTQLLINVSGQMYTPEVKVWKGSLADPYTFDEMAEKFENYASPYLTYDRVQEIVESVRNLDQMEDVAVLGGMLTSS